MITYLLYYILQTTLKIKKPEITIITNCIKYLKFTYTYTQIQHTTGLDTFTC